MKMKKGVFSITITICLIIIWYLIWLSYNFSDKVRLCQTVSSDWQTVLLLIIPLCMIWIGKKCWKFELS